MRTSKIALSLLFIAIAWGNISLTKAQEQEPPIYRDSVIEASRRYAEGNKYQKDLLLFTDLLKQAHPAFAPGEKAPFDIDSLQTAGYRYAANFKTDTQFQRWIKTALAKLNDGHAEITLKFDAAHFYPFNIFIDRKNNIIVTMIEKSKKEFLGKQITAINGHPVWTVLNNFRSMMSCDNDAAFRHSIAFNLENRWQFSSYQKSDSTIDLTFSDNSHTVLHPMALKNIHYASLLKEVTDTISRPSDKPFEYKLLLQKKICYLQFNQCYDRNILRIMLIMEGENSANKEELEKIIAQTPDFTLFLNKMFTDIRQNKIKTLVIDDRNNGGGSSILCEQLLSWLKLNINKGNDMIRFSRLWEQNYGELANEYKKAVIDYGLNYELGKLYNEQKIDSMLTGKQAAILKKTDELCPLNRDKTKLFKGKVVFILGENTFSSAGMLLTMARDNHIGTIIGTNSTFKPNNYGDVLVWRLPNTKISGRITHKIMMRPDQSKRDEKTLKPDVDLSPDLKDLSSGKDLCMEWIYKHY